MRSRKLRFTYMKSFEFDTTFQVVIYHGISVKILLLRSVGDHVWYYELNPSVKNLDFGYFVLTW